MCPLISPARAALVSFIFALISEWPAFHITGWPPCRAMSSYIVCEHFTSPTIAAPGSSASTARERRIIIWSPQRMCPWSSTTPTRSASPSKASPQSYFPFTTFRRSSSTFFSTVGSGWWLGNVPSGSRYIPSTWNPRAS